MHPRPVGDVVIWRDILLPPSETFIVNQMRALRDWRPRLAGLYRHESKLLPVEPALVLGRTGHRLLRRTGIEPRLLAMLARPRTRLVHAHFGVDATTVLPVARLARCPLVVTFHGYDVNIEKDQLPSVYAERWDDLMAYAGTLIAVSHQIAEKLAKAGAPEKKIEVHRIGVPLPEHVPPVAADRPEAILFVGRVVEKKNLTGLLRAVSGLPGELRRTPIRVVGDGERRDEAERLATALGLQVTFLGAGGTDLVEREMRSATIFASPGRIAQNGDAEGLPITPLEAAAHRLPVIVGQSGGSPAAVQHGETGFVVDGNSDAEITRALEYLLVNRVKARQMGELGRRFVQNNFDMRDQTTKLELIYETNAKLR